jgi:hypothetical protein
MEVLNGLYRIKHPHLLKEKHGGGILTDEVFWYLSFYEDRYIGMYGSGANDYRRFISKDFDLKGELDKFSEGEIEFYILNKYTHDKIIFRGQVNLDGKILRLIAYNEATPDNFWIDDEFEKI